MEHEKNLDLKNYLKKHGKLDSLITIPIDVETKQIVVELNNRNIAVTKYLRDLVISGLKSLKDQANSS